MLPWMSSTSRISSTIGVAFGIDSAPLSRTRSGVRLFDRTFGAVNEVRILELHGNRRRLSGDFHFLEDARQRIGDCHWLIADLVALLRHPAEEIAAVRIVAGRDCIVDVGVGAELV